MIHGTAPTSEDIAPDFWGGTTNPAEHDPTNFRYLVHGILPESKELATLLATYASNRPTDAKSGDQSISLYREPERLAERISLSMSLMDQDHTVTWGNAGLIVEAPEHNVILTSEEDAGAHNNDVKSLLWDAAQRPIMTGDDLLARTRPQAYNEVTALANRDGSTLRLAGFFYITTRDGRPVDPAIARQMQEHATRIGLPIVAIRKPSPYGPDGVNIFAGTVSVRHDGRYYMLDGHDDDRQFLVGDDMEAYHFASPNEIATALDYAVLGGLPRERAAEIAAKYEVARIERETSRAQSDGDATVTVT